MRLMIRRKFWLAVTCIYSSCGFAASSVDDRQDHACVADGSVAESGACVSGSEAAKCDEAVEENGYSGTVRIEDAYVTGEGTPDAILVLVVSKEQYTQLARRLRCGKGSSGYVLVEDTEWIVHLRLAPRGRSIYGRLRGSHQRVLVIAKPEPV